MAFFEKKIIVSLDNRSPYNLTFVSKSLKWGRVTQPGLAELARHDETDVVLEPTQNSGIIEGELLYAIAAPVKNAQLRIQVRVSQDKPYVFHAELSVDGRKVDFIPVSDRERLQINLTDDTNEDTLETQYQSKLTLISLAHQ